MASPPGIHWAREFYCRPSAHEKSPEIPGIFNTPKGSRTPVLWLRTRCPGPLDDGGVVTAGDYGFAARRSQAVGEWASAGAACAVLAAAMGLWKQNFSARSKAS